jgi:hypothetical protein
VGDAARPVAGARFPRADGKLTEGRRVSNLRKKFTEKNTRGVVTTKTARHSSTEQQGFCTGDVLWALGIWSVILTLSPVVIFYLLMVN